MSFAALHVSALPSAWFHLLSAANPYGRAGRKRNALASAAAAAGTLEALRSDVQQTIPHGSAALEA